jgi:hypothetical protein
VLAEEVPAEEVPAEPRFAVTEGSTGITAPPQTTHQRKNPHGPNTVDPSCVVCLACVQGEEAHLKQEPNRRALALSMKIELRGVEGVACPRYMYMYM